MSPPVADMTTLENLSLGYDDIEDMSILTEFQQDAAAITDRGAYLSTDCKL